MKFVTSLLLITLGLMTDGYTVGFDDDDIQEVTYNELKRSTEAPSEQRTLITQEGFRENANKFKDKVKQKVNGTVSGAKDKIKQKIKDKIKQKAKDKVKKKIEEKLDPTGGYMKFPVIFGVVVTIIISFFVLCIVCCCCCPFCLLHKRRTRGVVFRPAPPTVQTQVVTVVPTQPGYTPIQNNTHLQQPYPPQGYAAPPQGYMPQPQLQPQPQPQPQLQPQPGYVPLAANPPYPTSTCLNPAQSGNPSSENPPPYTEKQLPFNPNY